MCYQESFLSYISCKNKSKNTNVWECDKTYKIIEAIEGVLNNLSGNYYVVWEYPHYIQTGFSQYVA